MYTTLRDFPQTKLDSEINARFLLNEHGLLDNFDVQIIRQKVKKKKSVRKEK